VIPCGDMHQSFTEALVKWFFDKFPMFADSFRLISIHCVARGLGSSFLNKCPASRGGSLREHDLLVTHLTCIWRPRYRGDSHRNFSAIFWHQKTKVAAGPWNLN